MKNAVRIALLAMLFPSVANAVECRSVGGHWGGKQVSAVRQVEVVGQSIAVTGTFEGQTSPMRMLACEPLARGVNCEAAFGPVAISIMTNGTRMIETVVDQATGEEQAGLSYQCNGEIRM